MGLGRARDQACVSRTQWLHPFIVKLPQISKFLFMLLALTLSGFAQTEAESVIAEVFAANAARSAALVAHDLNTLDRLLAPDFNYTHSNNFQETKATHIGSLENGLRYAQYETSALRAHVITPEVVTLNGIFDQTKGMAGEMKSGQYLFLAVWRRNGNVWQLTSFQSALPPPAK